MSATQPFSPHQGSNQIFTLAAATGQAVIVDAVDKNLRIANAGANPVHFRTYSSKDAVPAVAAITDCPVLANMASTFTKPMSHDRVSLFSTLGSSVHVCTGEGW